MRRRRSARLLGNSLLLEFPISVFDACHQLTEGHSLELFGSAKKSDLDPEGITFSVKKALHTICFELRAVQVGPLLEELLHDSWHCVIEEVKENSCSAGNAAKNKHKKQPSKKVTSISHCQEGGKNAAENTSQHSEDLESSGSLPIPLAAPHLCNTVQEFTSVKKDPEQENKANVGSDFLEEETSPQTTESKQENNTPNSIQDNDSLESKMESLSPNVCCSACGKDFTSSRTPMRSLAIHEKRYCLARTALASTKLKGADHDTINSLGNDNNDTKLDDQDGLDNEVDNGGDHSADADQNDVNDCDDDDSDGDGDKNLTDIPPRKTQIFTGRKSYNLKVNQCAYCKQNFTSRITKHRHETFVCPWNPNVVKPHTCRLCRRPFHTQAKLVEHMANKHRDGRLSDQEKKCEFCGMVFKRANSLYVHKRTTHKIKDPKYRCPHCGKAFHFKDPYNMHVATHSEERPQLCPNCGKRFKNRDQLLKHRNRIHLDKWPYRCEKCGHGMDTKKSLATHQCHRARRNPDGSHKPNKYPKKVTKKDAEADPTAKKGSGKVEKPELPKVTCAICGQKRKNYETLLKHVVQTHSGMPNYDQVLQNLMELVKVTCPECHKEFRNGKTLKEHMQNVHVCEQCKCEYCEKVFRTASHVKAHIKNVHQSKPGKYVCDQCPSVFKSRKNLVWHIRYQHTKLERKYKCPQCDFRYAFDKQYYEHRTRVHGPKKQECPWCGYRCATRWYMNKHMKNCASSHVKLQNEPTTNSQDVNVSCSQSIDVTSSRPLDIKSEFPEALIQLEGGQVIVEEKPIDQKQLLEQLTQSTVLPQSLNDVDKCLSVSVVKPLDEHTIIELPASWSEKTVPENVSVDEITCVQQSAEQLVPADVQQYCIIQEDGSKQIIQVVYANTS